MRRFISGFVCAAVLAGVGQAGAADGAQKCGEKINVRPTKTAPVNTHVWVSVGNGGGFTERPRFKVMAPDGEVSGKWRLVHSNALIVLRRGEKPGRLVQQFVPTTDLKPNTEYRVLTADDREVRKFTTTAKRDEEPPKWGGITQLDVHDGKSKRPRASGATATMHLAPASDDTADAQDIAYALWLVRSEKGLDAGRRPEAFLWAHHDGKLHLQAGHECRGENFPFPLAGQPAFVVARALDLAGRPSDPVTLRFTGGNPDAPEVGTKSYYPPASGDGGPSTRDVLMIVGLLIAGAAAAGALAFELREL